MPLNLNWRRIMNMNINREESSSSSSSSSNSNTTSSSSRRQSQSPSYSQNTSSASSSEEETILSSIIYCIHYKDGCTWSDELKKLKDHLNNCRYDVVSCPQCQCDAVIPRLLLDEHLRFSCNLRKATCHICSKVFTVQEIEAHRKTCQKSISSTETNNLTPKPELKKKPQGLNSNHQHLVECSGCNRQILSSFLAKHQVYCEGSHKSADPIYENPCFILKEQDSDHSETKENNYANISKLTPCLFNDIGCTFKGQKRCLEAHLNDNNGEHASLISSITSKQQQQIIHLRKSLSKLSLNHTGTLVWKIKGFAAKLREAKSREGVEIVGNSFYTGPYGYKIQASVFLNGNGVGEGSHISVYIKILPGEFDGMVKWPFSHPVLFTLYDQNPEIEQILNIVESFNPDSNWINFQRPSHEPDVLGFGFPRFVSHETLKKRHYLQGDTLFLRIKIDTAKRV